MFKSFEMYVNYFYEFLGFSNLSIEIPTLALIFSEECSFLCCSSLFSIFILRMRVYKEVCISEEKQWNTKTGIFLGQVV
jgi:hypothetical protein